MLKVGNVELLVKIVVDKAGIYGVFSSSWYEMRDAIEEECKKYRWKDAKLEKLNKLNRPYYWTIVYFGERRPYSYRYLFLMRMIDCVAKLSHCSRKLALRDGIFYRSKKDGKLLFTVNKEIWGVLAPIVEV